MRPTLKAKGGNYESISKTTHRYIPLNFNFHIGGLRSFPSMAWT